MRAGRVFERWQGAEMGFKRVTIIGASGFVGSEVASYLRGKGLLLQTPRSAAYDANRRDDLVRLVDDTRPEVIINCAGHTGKPNVDACEEQKAECLQGNAVMPALIREVAREKGLVFGHVSSGCIFTGRREDGGVSGSATRFLRVKRNSNGSSRGRSGPTVSWILPRWRDWGIISLLS